MGKNRAGIVVINKESQKILTIFRRKKMEEYWTIPGGGIEKGEEPREAAIREIREETGLEVKRCEPMTIIDFGNKKEYYFFTDYKGGEIKLGGGERERNSLDNYYELQWLSINVLDELKLYPRELKDVLISKLKTI